MRRLPQSPSAQVLDRCPQALPSFAGLSTSMQESIKPLSCSWGENGAHGLALASGSPTASWTTTWAAALQFVSTLVFRTVGEFSTRYAFFHLLFPNGPKKGRSTLHWLLRLAGASRSSTRGAPSILHGPIQVCLDGHVCGHGQL